MATEKQKVREGRVISDKMANTVVVAVSWVQTHPLYRQRMRRITKFYAHDKDNDCRIGDLVRIRETRPLSRLKRWRVVEILERREIVAVKPAEVEEEGLAEVIAPPVQAPIQETSPEKIPQPQDEAIDEEVAVVEDDEEDSEPQDTLDHVAPEEQEEEKKEK